MEPKTSEELKALGVPDNETAYIVPLHVGQNIVVPKGSKIFFYDVEESA
jgi:hypothetical protein